jgi:L-ribulose-5-phosphate 4-epimerase
MLESLKVELVALNQELARNNLVAWTSGNVSARDGASGLVVIGVGRTLRAPCAEHMVVLDLQGRVVEGSEASSDTSSHLHLQERPYVAAWCTPITPCHGLCGPGKRSVCSRRWPTNSGGPIPCGGFA